ncbi:hypothetical protein ACFOW4_19935 [Micromonospora sp. GCM10011542]|uniref:hypothetical protein n=1 Tax=Micromonospora sp. GCM10011542 TaxID=3317337 RepID=UPI00361F20FC
MALRRAVAVLGIVAVLTSGCSWLPDRDDPSPQPLRPVWTEVALPTPPGPAGRLMVRDAAVCADRWYVVGAVGDATGVVTRPAAWTSLDGTSWTAMALTPISYYGRQNVLYSVACRSGRIAVLGAKRGGAHANPRTSSWQHLPDGTLTEVRAPYDLYGGSQAVDVARMVSGARGWLITGNRTSGAAVWRSPDAARFQIVEGAPQLASDGAGETWNFDAVETESGWLAVGGVIPPGRVDRDPLAWRSDDGVTWQRVPVPGGPEYDELQRVVLLQGRPVAVGLRGRAFGAWRADGGSAGQWRAAGGFGRGQTEGIPGVRGLTVAGDGLFAATTDGSGHALWRSTDAGESWRPVAAPVPAPSGAERAATIVGTPDQLLVLIDDARAGRVFRADANVP